MHEARLHGANDHWFRRWWMHQLDMENWARGEELKGDEHISLAFVCVCDAAFPFLWMRQRLYLLRHASLCFSIHAFLGNISEFFFPPNAGHSWSIASHPNKHDDQSYRCSRRPIRFTTIGLRSSGRLHSSISCHHHRLPIAHVYGFPRSIHPSLMPCSFFRIARFLSLSIVQRDVVPSVSSSTSSSSSPCSTMFFILRARLPHLASQGNRRGDRCPTPPYTTVHDRTQRGPGEARWHEGIGEASTRTWRMSGRGGADRNASHTAYLGGLDVQVTEELVWELMVQAGPVGACDDVRRRDTT